MIYFNFKLSNPWVKYKPDAFQNLMCIEKSMTENKTFFTEFISCEAFNIFGIELDTRFNGSDHAQVAIYIELFGFEYSIGFRDNRHWNYYENRWYNKNEKIESDFENEKQ